ncbi:glycerophosphodiester phosphodiesterase family protein [Leptospira inadai serovar Lyme str. 10]|uniref:Glycerophosphodiester phosphodiesterase family protein n=2 Tax=Leptospira inadai serovar Lyme TaxID=293084 RepID=V6H8N9_9LEPT|nr:glycerophosphodiester phosphodiesterase family protein [Leptospira inadai serovar Lyme str. 10]
MLAFRKAVEVGADWIELDVTLTADREVVVIHDDTLDRTTNMRGPVREASFERIRKADAGGWKDIRFVGEPVPKIWDVWNFVLGTELGLNIEIKTSAYEPSPKESPIEDSLIRFALDKKALDKTLFSSFCWDSLVRIRELSTDAKLGILIGEETPHWEEALDLAFRLNAFSLNLSSRMAQKEIVSKIQEQGFSVFVYTLNTEEELRKGLDAGADGIFTNYPARMKLLVN